MLIAILGFGHLPPAHNLELAAVAAEQIAAAGLGVAVGSLKGTFATAIDVAAKNGAPTLAAVDPTMAEQPHPATTEIVVIAPNEKHQRITQIASAGLVLGGPRALGNWPLSCWQQTKRWSQLEKPAARSMTDHSLAKSQLSIRLMKQSSWCWRRWAEGAVGINCNGERRVR